jgi:nucleotide-binding universal stress UspA family protein
VFNTVVLGLDTSEGSKLAVPVGSDIARRYEARLMIVHVDERIAAKGGLQPVKPDEELIRRELEEQAQQLLGQGIDTVFEVVEVVLGGPAHAIEQVAERESAELIVVGRRGHSPVAGLVLGSVTQRLLHIAQRSVLAAPPLS